MGIRHTLILLIALCSCARTQYVPVIEYRDKYVTQHVFDSIRVLDSIFVAQITRGDTVFTDKVVYKYIYRDKVRSDTLIQRDSIPVIVEVEKVVEVNKLKWWQKCLIYAGLFTMIFLFYKLIRR